MTTMTRKITHSAFAVFALTLLSGCAHKAWMMVPAKVDLGGYGRVGIVDFTCAEVTFERRATDRFQQLVLDGMPGTQMIELGTEKDALASVDRTELDADSIRAIAEKHEIDALFLGSVEFSKMQPKIGVGISLVEVNARAELRTTMSVRLIETDTGSTVWLRTADNRITVAHADLSSEGRGNVNVEDLEGKKATAISSLTSHLTTDFRAHYYKKKLKEIPPHYEVTYPDGVEVYVPPE